MIEADLHCHSSYSLCGLHSYGELLTRARTMGLKGIAVTDHGPATHTRIPPTFFSRLRNPEEGIRLFRGAEANIIDEYGRIDIPRRNQQRLDILLAGFHANLPAGLSRAIYTEILIRSFAQSPGVDIIS
ncbi:MAG: PHP domain-containing protein, partial [Fibrobacterota bacterium]